MLSVMTSGVCFTVRRHFFTNQCLILISLLCVSKLWLIAGESNGKSNTEANYNKEINDFASETQEDIDELIMQEQKAICTIVTGNVKASAEAYYSTKPSSHFDPLRNQEEDRSSFTTSYSKEMYLLLGLMEQRLIKEIEKIKTIVESLEIQCPSSIENRSVCLCDQKTPGSNLNNSNSERKVKSLSSLLSQKSRFNDNDSDTNTTLFNSNQQYLNVLRYSWKMENFTEHLNLMPFEHSVYSPTFSIRDKPFRIRVIFHHLHRDYIYLQLIENNRSQSLMDDQTIPNANRSRISNRANAKINYNDQDDPRILFNVNMIFQQISDEQNFSFKHKIAILDQSNRFGNTNLASQTFHNLKIGFSVPNSALMTGSYIKNNTLSIHIIAFL